MCVAVARAGAEPIRQPFFVLDHHLPARPPPAMLYNFLPNALQWLLASHLWSAEQPARPPGLTFELRHEHGTTSFGRNVFSNTAATDTASIASEPLRIATKRMRTHRPPSLHAVHEARVARALGAMGLSLYSAFNFFDSLLDYGSPLPHSPLLMLLLYLQARSQIQANISNS